MLYKVTFDTPTIAGINKTMPEEEVLPFVKAISDLGFTPEVTLVKE